MGGIGLGLAGKSMDLTWEVGSFSPSGAHQTRLLKSMWTCTSYQPGTGLSRSTRLTGAYPNAW